MTNASVSAPPVRPSLQTMLGGLRRFNAGLGVLHLVQGIAMLVLASAFSLPVTSSFLQLDPASEKLVAVADELFRVQIGPLVAGFLLLSAAAHLALASPALRRWYEHHVSRGINPARWIEYSLSSSVMIVVIALLAGIYDIAALLVLFALNASMILFGWLMEVHNQTTARTNWTPYWFGCFAGAVRLDRDRDLPGRPGRCDQGPPAFVYAIFVSLFVFFNCSRSTCCCSTGASGPVARLPVRRARLRAGFSLVAKSLSPGRCSPGHSSRHSHDQASRHVRRRARPDPRRRCAAGLHERRLPAAPARLERRRARADGPVARRGWSTA